jgi:hypothetical protein
MKINQKGTSGEVEKTNFRAFSTQNLPSINDEEFAAAVQPKNVQFIRDLCSNLTIGRFHWFESMGFVLQNGGNGELRCIYLVDHPDIELDLAFVNATINHVGAKLVFAPYTVVVPYDEKYASTMNIDKDSDSSSAPASVGMEVA